MIQKYQARKFIERIRRFGAGAFIDEDSSVKERGKKSLENVLGPLVVLGAIAVPVAVYAGFKYFKRQEK